MRKACRKQVVWVGLQRHVIICISAISLLLIYFQQTELFLIKRTSHILDPWLYEGQETHQNAGLTLEHGDDRNQLTHPDLELRHTWLHLTHSWIGMPRQLHSVDYWCRECNQNVIDEVLELQVMCRKLQCVIDVKFHGCPLSGVLWIIYDIGI